MATRPRPGGAVISVRLTVLLPVLSTIEPETSGTPSTSAPATAARRKRLAAKRRAGAARKGNRFINMDDGVSTEWGGMMDGMLGSKLKIKTLYKNQIKHI